MTGKRNASNARVGIIVPAYNYGHYLDECLGSLAAQTWGDFTALVIDNASTDDTEDVARAWVARDARFRYVRNDTNLGLTRSMLKAYALLDNELMMLLSADDLLAPRFLEATVGALDAHPECPMAYTAWETMLDNPGDPAHGQRGQAFIPHQRSGVYDDSAVLLSHNWITISIGIWRRQACEVVGGFDPQGLRHLGDWFLWMRLLSEGPAYYVHEPLGAYRIHSAAESRRLISSNQSGDDHVRFYDLIYANERWPMTIRCLAKAHQMRWMTGEPMMSIVDKLGGPRAHPIIRLMMESVRHDVIVGAARAVLEYTPEPNTLDTSANAIAALAQVLAEAPGHAAARALLAEHGGAGAPNAPIALTDAAARRAKAWITADLARHTPAAAITVLIDARHEGPLRRTLRSLDHQWHPAARIVLVDAPEQPAVAGYHCLSSKDLDDWIAARHAEPGWLLGLAAGDELADDALYHCARAIDTHPQARLVYTDHDEIGRDDCHRNPNHKPDANPELLRSTPYIGRALVVHTAHLVDATAPLDLVSSHRIALETLDTAGAEALVHVPALLMHLDARTAITLPGSPEQSEALNAMVHAHAGRLHPGTTVIDGPGIGQFAWLPPLDATPLVSIIVPTKDQLDLLRRCLDTLMHQTKYPAFEVIVVDNDSQTDEARAYLANLEAGVDPRIRVLRHPGVFNFSAMNNRAASIANGAYLLLLNNDTEVIDPYWLNTMMRHATRDAVGAVGPLLVLPDGRIQHAGVILGLRGPANHPFIGDDPEAPGYLGRVHLQQNFSAVGGACLLTRKSLYLRLGGLDETDFSVSYNDIDYCLRLREAGYEVTWTPLARLIHLGSASQLIDIEDMSLSQKITRFQGEQLNMVCKWASLIAHDPAYNPNLTVRGVGFEPESEPLLRFDPLAHLGQARVLALIAAAPGTCRHRILEPLCALKAAGTITGGLLPAPVDPHLVLHTGADHLILQLPDTLNELDGLRNLTALPDLHTLLDGDDLLRPLPYLDNTQPDFLADPGEQTALFIRSCDTILASNPRLAAAFAPLHDDVRVVPERLHPALWSAPPEPLRAGEAAGPVRAAWWSSSATDAALIDALQTHFGDRVRFICLGACPPALAERSSVLTPPAATGLPAWLAEQHWDVGLLPLVDGAVAALGSDIDLQRLGWVGCPVLCSDVPAFCGDLPVTRLPQDAEAWIAALGALIDAPERRAMEGAALQQAVLRTMGSLTNAPDAWRDSVVGAPSSGALAVELEDCEALLAELLLPLSPATPRPRAAANAPAHPPTAAPSTTSTDDEDAAARERARAQVTALGTPDAASSLLDNDYATFLDQRAPIAEDMQFIEASAARWAHAPTIQVLVEARASEFELLSTTLDSLGAQPYGLWSLSIVSNSPCPDPSLAELPNIDWVHDATATAAAKPHFDTLVADRGADIVVCIPPGTAFDPLCLWRVAHEFAGHPDWMALYTDDDVMRMDGNRVEPRFKPDFNLDLLRGTDYIGPLWTRTEAWQRAGGFSAQAGTRFYDLTLRVLDTVGAAAIGHIADPLLSLPVSPTLLIADKEAAEAVSTHLTRCGQAHRIRPGNLHGSWHVTYEHDTRPAVDVVVPYRNWLEFTEPLVDSLFRLTEWPQFRLILVDAGSDDADCAAWRDRLIDTHGEQIRYVRSDTAWNWSELFNLGAAHSDAPYLLFLHHDTQILSGHWLERLMAHAMRPEVAAVAPRQAIPGDNSLDMTGTVFGLAPGLASPEAAGTAMDYPGYLGRLQLTQNFSLLASACLLVPRTRFDAVGGFDPQFGQRDAVADLTARLARDGLLVWTPTVTVAHYETDLPPIEAADELDCVEMTAHTQTALIRERVGFVRRYQDGLSRDPAWNLNLRLKADDIQPETTFVPPWHAIPADIPRVVADVVRGAGEYRAAAPLRAARRAGKAMGAIIQPPALNARRMLNAIELARLDGVTSFLIHNPALKEQIPVLQQMHTHLPNLPVIGLMDDLSTAVPHQSDLFDQWSRETRTYMRRCLALCDRLVVSTEPLAEFARHMIDDIRIVPNRLEWARWGHVQSRRRAGRRPRVGWAGAFQHAGDLALVEEAIRLTSQEVDWIFFGMCPASLAPYVREHHTWVDFDHYPEGLASLNLDLAIAPLEENIFNDAKSNLRLLDYGILGWPVVCSDVTPYRGAPVTRVANTTEAWVKAIREHVHDLDAAEQAGDRLREWVLADYILEEHVDEWLADHLP